MGAFLPALLVMAGYMLDLISVADEDWLMFPGERLALAGLLSQLKPEIAIEVGVYHGASTQLLSSYAKKVYALDIDPAARDHLEKRKLANVECIIGDSPKTIPALLDRLEQQGLAWNFVLIDADHRADAVRSDCRAFMRRPPADCYVLMHDSFNPECRRGISTAGWSNFDYCHFFDLDLAVGNLGMHGKTYREMWRGFALAVLTPEQRNGPLVVSNDHQAVFEYINAYSLQTQRRALRELPGNVAKLTSNARMFAGRVKQRLLRTVGL